MNPSPPRTPAARTVTLRALAITFVFLSLGAQARADLAADYAALTAGVQGQSATISGSPGGVAMFGAAAFPVLLGTAGNGQAVMAAGRYGDSYAASAARAVAYSHTSMFDTTGGVRTTLFSNAVLWASRHASPTGTIAVVVSNTTVGTFLTGLGYTVRSATNTITAANLSGAHVLVLSAQTNYSDSVMALIASFTAGGGGIVTCQTPWAASAAVLADSTAMLDPFGLLTYGTVPSDSSWTIASAPPSILYSAIPATDALIADKEGTSVLSVADRTIAINTINLVTGLRMDLAGLNARMATLGDSSHYGMIAPTLAAQIATASKPVEKMLAQYQSRTFDALTPAQLFVHPCAADFPGLPDAGATTVSRTVSINGNTATNFYMNQGGKPTRTESGLYAPPGATITVTIPADKVAEGLQVHIAGNGSEDTTFNIATWTFFPKLWRRVSLTTTATQTGNVFGGLITILVPAGKSLGTFNVTIDGAIEAPVFVLGQTTDAQWNGGLSTRAAPYGYIQNSKLTIYVPKVQLAQMTQPTAVATHWQQVMDIADEYYGYTSYRKRSEAYATARYVGAGAAYAGYPVEAGWGTTDNQLLEAMRYSGDWGSYHELGHGFQDNFDSAFVIATHAEVDVNLMPAMVITMLHDQTTWDYTGTYFGSSDRASKRAAFMALPAAQQLWNTACSTTGTTGAAYDFYYNLSDAFGWQVYKTALGRLMNFLQNPVQATDPELFALNSADTNFKRNRFYLLFCDAAGRNLDAYFQRYGLGVVGRGYEITQSVKDQVAAKGNPAWIDNTAIDSLSNPGTLAVSEDVAPGTQIYQFVATDADEPGTIWDYQITAGNTNGAFSIDRRTGRLRAQKIDAETLANYTLTVQVQDNGVPRYSASQTFTVNVTGAPEPPQVAGRLFTANSAMSNGTSIGSVPVTFESGRSASSFAIVAGNDGHFAINSLTGAITVTNAGTLPNPGVFLLTIRVEDTSQAVGFGKVAILCNRSTGVLEERWASGQMIGTPSTTSTFSTFTSPQNVGSNYARRVSGWLVPQVSGMYQFWIASDDGSTFAISPNEIAANRVPAGGVDPYTGFQSWDEKGSQKSALIYLKAGYPSYVEAQQREGGGGDHVAVAWQGPGIARQVIPTSVLIPRDATASFPASTLTATEQWRIGYFGALAGDASVSGFDVDYEGDGLKNLLEYAAGTHPGALSNAPSQASVVSNRLAITFTHNTGATDITVTVQGSDTLTSWTDLARSTAGGSFVPLIGGVTISESGAGTIRTVEVRDLYALDDPAHPRRFLRALATAP